jgi:hypothetical protein
MLQRLDDLVSADLQEVDGGLEAIGEP